jgi:glycosyltransferase involved in cell wall biosynthesis
MFLTSQLPYPPVSGGTIKSWRLLKHLSRSFDVTLLTLLKGNDAENYVAMSDEVVLGSSSRGFPIARGRTPWNFLRSLLASPTLNVFRNSTGKMSKAVDAALKRCDLVLVDHLEVFSYVPRGIRIPVVLHEHNAEYVMWERSRSVARSLVENIVLAIESKRVKRFEVDACKRADLILAAPNDQLELAKVGVPKDRFHTTYHLGDDSGLQAPALQFDEASNNLLYVGTLSWPANADGLLWFLNEVWPSLRSMHPSLTLDIIGRGAEEGLRTVVARAGGAVLRGFVEDLEPYYRKSKVFIAPLRFGSGTKVKVITAMYRGLPCATTTVGAEGLDLVPEKEIMLADDVEGTTKNISRLLTDRGVWESMRDASRAKAKRDLAWNSMLDGHVIALRKVLPTRN